MKNSKRSFTHLNTLLLLLLFLQAIINNILSVSGHCPHLLRAGETHLRKHTAQIIQLIVTRRSAHRPSPLNIHPLGVCLYHVLAIMASFNKILVQFVSPRATMIGVMIHTEQQKRLSLLHRVAPSSSRSGFMINCNRVVMN